MAHVANHSAIPITLKMLLAAIPLQTVEYQLHQPMIFDRVVGANVDLN